MTERAKITLISDGATDRYEGKFKSEGDAVSLLFRGEELFTVTAERDCVRIKRSGENEYTLTLRRGENTPFDLYTPYGRSRGECATSKLTVRFDETSLFLSAEYTLSIDPRPRSITIEARLVGAEDKSALFPPQKP